MSYKTKHVIKVPSITNYTHDIIEKERKESLGVSINPKTDTMQISFSYKTKGSIDYGFHLFKFNNFELCQSDFYTLQDSIYSLSNYFKYFKCNIDSVEKKLEQVFLELIKDNGLEVLNKIPSVIYSESFIKGVKRIINQKILQQVEEAIPYKSKKEIMNNVENFRNLQEKVLQERIEKKKEIEEIYEELRKI